MGSNTSSRCSTAAARLNRLTIDNTDFGTNNTALGGDAVQIVASNTATVNVTVTNSGFTNAREDLFNAVATQTAEYGRGVPRQHA